MSLKFQELWHLLRAHFMICKKVKCPFCLHVKGRVEKLLLCPRRFPKTSSPNTIIMELDLKYELREKAQTFTAAPFLRSERLGEGLTRCGSLGVFNPEMSNRYPGRDAKQQS